MNHGFGHVVWLPLALCLGTALGCDFNVVNDDGNAGGGGTGDVAYVGAFVGQLSDNVNAESPGTEPFDAVVLDVGEASGLADAWIGDVQARLAVVAARLDANGGTVVDSSGQVVFEVVGWVRYDGGWSHQADFTAATFDYTASCVSVEVVAQPALQLSCATDFIPTQLAGRCTLSGSNLLICSGLTSADLTLSRQNP